MGCSLVRVPSSACLSGISEGGHGSKGTAYRIEYTEPARSHLRGFSARLQAVILQTVVVQLTHEPSTQTRNRKPMRANPIATWELRIGDLRVYYDLEESPEPRVQIRAIGVKERNQVRIGGQIIPL
jgi:mRNA-degrading endonuclease RelE of RelBE toxin-antitoxin system